MNKGRSWIAANPQHSDDLWAAAAKWNAERPGNGEWVPKEALVIPEWTPRTIHADTVEEYRAQAGQLPPIVVQRDTFVLIDGRHRLAAEPSDYVRIVELEIDDADLVDEAIRANTIHGLRYTLAERTRNLVTLLTRHPEWSDAVISAYAGVHRSTVREHREKAAGKAKAESERASLGVQQTVNIAETAMLTERHAEQYSERRSVVGVDGRERRVPEWKAPASSVNGGRDIRREPEPERRYVPPSFDPGREIGPELAREIDGLFEEADERMVAGTSPAPPADAPGRPGLVSAAAMEYEGTEVFSKVVDGFRLYITGSWLVDPEEMDERTAAEAVATATLAAEKWLTELREAWRC